MAETKANHLLLVLSLTGGAFTMAGVTMANHLMFALSWITSGKHLANNSGNLLTLFNTSSTFKRLELIGALLGAFLAGAIAVYLVSKRPVHSFLREPSTSKGWPGSGIFIGLLCGLASCVLFVSVGAVVGIVLDSFKHDVSIGLLLLGPLAFSTMAIYLVGFPVALIGGTIGGVTELVLRRMYKPAEVQDTHN